jgi:hypothetical protein
MLYNCNSVSWQNKCYGAHTWHTYDIAGKTVAKEN